MKPLKQSTSTTVQLGPAVDKADGVTAETGLTPTIYLSKAGAAQAARNSAGAIAHDRDGYYRIPLDTTDTNTLGDLLVQFTDAATHLPVWERFTVLAANVYDSLIAATDTLQADVTQWLGTAAATPTVAGVPEVDVTHWLGTAAATPTTAGVPEVDITHIAGSAVSVSTAQLGVNVVNFGGSAGTFASGIPAVNATQVSGDSTAADNLESEFDGTGYLSYHRRNTAAAGAASTITLDASASTTADIYKGMIVRIVGGTGAGQARTITAYSTGRVATVDRSWTTNPDNTSVFVIAYANTPALDTSLHVTANSTLVLTSEAEVEGQTFEIEHTTGYDFDYTFTLTGVTSTDWQTFAFAIKRVRTESDADARVLARVTNGGAGTDGLLTFNGTDPTASGLTTAYAAISVTGTTPDTVVRVIVRAAAMQLDPSDVTDGVFYAELCRYDTTGTPDPKTMIANGTITLTQGVLRSSTSP